MAMVIDLMAGPDKKGPAKSVGEDAESTAIRQFFEAGKSGDYEAATAAFKRAYHLCSLSSDSEPDAYDKGEADEGE